MRLPIIILLLFIFFQPTQLFSAYRIGAGKADVTGQIFGQAMFGYGLLTQRTKGIHTRLFSRAFVIEDNISKKKVALVVVDLAFITEEIKQEVLWLLNSKKIEGFHSENVMISATHTHSGPGGYLHPLLYNFTSYGFNKFDFKLISSQIARSIEKANTSLQEGIVSFSRGELKDTTQNRSLVAFEKNPNKNEIINFYHGVTDPWVSQLVFRSLNGSLIGILNWFSIHPTSLSSKNLLISGDSKGLASLLFEKKFPGAVAAFANSNEGDISPIRNPESIAETEQAMWIGSRQFEKAKSLLDLNTVLKNDLSFTSQKITMPGFTIKKEFTGDTEKKLCPSALGLSFVAGAEDGRTGIKGYYEGLKQGDEFDPGFIERGVFYVFGKSLLKRTDELLACHYPKAIWLGTGLHKPSWTYDRAEFQIIRIGSLAIVAVPSELTVAAGLEVRKKTIEYLGKQGVENIVISGLSNGYSHYVTTKEEYDTQQYEGASTLFGPYTLAAYKQIYSDLAKNLNSEKKIATQEVLSFPLQAPRFLSEMFQSKRQLKFLEQNHSGRELTVFFKTSDPNLDYQTDGSFIEVQKKNDNQTWEKIYSDTDPETELFWEYSTKLKVTVHIKDPGEYRVIAFQNRDGVKEEASSASIFVK